MVSINRVPVLLLVVLCLGAAAQAQSKSRAATGPSHQTSDQAADGERQSVTVPLAVEFNRPFIDLEFTRPDGSPRKARFWVDTGGGAFIMVEPLARELGLEMGQIINEGGQRFAAVKPPKASLGGMPLNLEGARASVAIGQKTMMPGVAAEGLFPAHVLMRYHVVFDYPGHRFTLAKPGALKPRGTRMSSPINPRSGFPRLDVQVGGETFGFLLDTGASFTMISQEQLSKWAAAHADWKQATGAVGCANMGLGPMEAGATMMRLPQFTLGAIALPDVAAVSRPQGTFEKFMSAMMTAPIVGAIGGNVWRAFRVEIDYSNGATYLEKSGAADSHDLDVVGAIVRAQADGSYTVVGVAKQDGKEVTDAIRAGDKLVKVD
ncbi:MAG TPA: retropepsin-like aspartic protease, partial [Blastocatellia bacterium]|nr:retropepsin-like aspartic protease [Blastocatellia bacterium]